MKTKLSERQEMRVSRDLSEALENVARRLRARLVDVAWMAIARTVLMPDTEFESFDGSLAKRTGRQTIQEATDGTRI
jgi:hypothetical protein